MKFLSVVVLLVMAPSFVWGQLCNRNYDKRIATIHQGARNQEGLKPRLVLTGSSTIRRWAQTDSLFPQFDAVNAGFGGSCFADLWRLRDTLIYALQPRVLLIYEGDNDLYDGMPQDEIVVWAGLLLEDLALRLPNTQVVVIAPKASAARYHLANSYRELSDKLRMAAMMHGASWVDFWNVQHHSDGTLRTELFADDRLHLNDLGYEVWARELWRQLPWLRPSP